MSEMRVVRLHFQGPIHLSDVRSDYGNSYRLVHSDSFYAALIASLAMVGKVPENGDLGVAISSLFPFYTEKEHTRYFFPKPFLEFSGFDGEVFQQNKGLAKKLKKVSWIEAPLLEQLVLRKPLNLNPANSGNWNAFLTQGDSGVPELMESSVRPRVAVSRENGWSSENKTTLFYMDEIRFIDGAGLFLMVYGENFEVFERALKILSSQGIGTDRSVGLGQFTSEVITANPLVGLSSIQSDKFCNLGLIAPHHERELLSWTAPENEMLRFDLIERGGWITNHQGKRKLNQYYFREGAVLSGAIKGFDIKGKRDINLAPALNEVAHPVWRSGQSLCIPVL